MKVAIITMLLVGSLGQVCCANKLQPPYNRLKKVLPYNAGYFYSNSKEMKKLLTERNPKVVIELGSFLGMSTIHIASNIRKDGIVYAVDHWRGSPEHQETESLAKLVPNLYERFLSNVIHKKLTHKIIPMRMTTLEAAEVFKKKGIIPDLIYVDAEHEEEAVYNELVAYFPLVKGHGIICGDDWAWRDDLPIATAVRKFAKENDLDIEVYREWFWILREKS